MSGAPPAERFPLLTTISLPLQRLAREPTLRGRTELIGALEAEMTGGMRSSGVHVLHGMGGMGRAW